MSLWDELFGEKLESNHHVDVLRLLVDTLAKIETDLGSIAATDDRRRQQEAQALIILKRIEQLLSSRPNPPSRLVLTLGKPIAQ